MIRRWDLLSHFSGGAPWAAVGILLLILINVAFDLARPGGSVFGDGAFLTLSLRDGVPGGHLIDILNHASKIIILAIGMTPVIATRGIDLSVGSNMAMSGAAAAVIVGAGHSPALAITTAMLVAAACGLWNGVLVSWFGLQPFIATLVLMVAGRGIAQMITEGQVATFQNPTLEFIGNGRLSWLPLPFPFVLAVVVFAGTLVAVRKSALGLLLEAVGGNPVASHLAGIRARTLIGGSYLFCGLCAGIAGLIAMSNIKGADPFHAGLNAELAAIFAVVIGGTPLTGGRFSLLGAFLGGILMQTLTATMYARNVSPEIAPLPQAIVILAVCLIASPGFRRRLSGRPA